MFLDGLAADGIEAIHLDHMPALGFCIQLRTTFVGLGGLTTHLVFGTDAEPDADAFLVRLLLFHYDTQSEILTSICKSR